MKTIGLLGGMSWESTAFYYRILNEEVARRLGGHHSARLVLVSVDFEEIKQLQHAGRWDEAAAILGAAGRALKAAGADFIVLCTNTMHRVAPAIEQASGLPLLHIADPTGKAIRARGLSRIGLLGTAFTMEQDFYRARLREGHDIEVVVPDAEDRALVHRVIYEELCKGIVRAESRAAYLAAIDRLNAAGAQGIILGCTEICMLVGQDDVALPVFDTTRLHAERAAALALGED